MPVGYCELCDQLVDIDDHCTESCSQESYENNPAYNDPANVISFFDLERKLHAKLDAIDASTAGFLRNEMVSHDTFGITELLRRSNWTGKMPIKAFDRQRSSIVRSVRKYAAKMSPAELKANDILIEVFDEYIDAAVSATGDLPLSQMRAAYKRVNLENISALLEEDREPFPALE
jgi:hypothetical protein